MSQILFSIVSYLIGCISGGYLVMKFLHDLDITQEGSGNAGALNAYEQSGSKMTAALVLIIDLLKGLLAIYLVHKFIISDYALKYYLAGAFVVLGHNYNAVLRFKGGRGLATAVGAFILITPYAIVLWLLMWLFGYFMVKRNVHIGNSVATLSLPLLLYITPPQLIEATSIVGLNAIEITIFSLPIVFLILLRHLDPIYQIIKGNYKQVSN